MERENRKRERVEEEEVQNKEKAKKQASNGEGAKLFAECQFAQGFGDEISKFTDSPGAGPLTTVFEFPWQTELVPETEEWKLFDNLSSSVEFSGDGLCHIPAPIEFPGEKLCPTPVVVRDEARPSESEEIDGVDCIWSCVLNQPICLIDKISPTSKQYHKRGTRICCKFRWQEVYGRWK